MCCDVELLLAVDPELDAAWIYRSWKELDGYPYWGRMATYGGGGYVASLGRDTVTATEALMELANFQ